MAKAYTLFELNEYIRRVLALNLPEAIWVETEIAQISQSKGHYFLTLIQKSPEEESILAQSEAVIWDKSFRRIQRINGKVALEVLRTGMAVKLHVRVDFNERYGLKLVVEDIDPAYTLGALELQKRASLEKLHNEGLITLNKRLALPPVLQRIAVLSSPEAAGFHDFVTQLEKNPYGFSFFWRLFPMAVQGQQVLPELRKQLKKIKHSHTAYDAVVLIRGGGGRTDLAAFDLYEVGATLAKCPLPIFTGIGHEIDETIADQVAFLALKTPTAVADFLINRSLDFESQLYHLARQIQNLGQYQIRNEKLLLGKKEQNLFFLCKNHLRQAQQHFHYLQDQIPRLCYYQLEKNERHFEQIRSSIDLLQPENLLRRGYSLTYRNGQLLRSAKELQPGDQLTTYLSDGRITSTVNQKEKN